MRFVSISTGSLYELETQLLLARRIEPRWAPALDRLLFSADSVGRMLTNLRKALKDSPAKP